MSALPGGNGASIAGDWDLDDLFPCSGYQDCRNQMESEDDVCADCIERNQRENAGGCPGCGGACQTACR